MVEIVAWSDTLIPAYGLCQSQNVASLLLNIFALVTVLHLY